MEMLPHMPGSGNVGKGALRCPLLDQADRLRHRPVALPGNCRPSSGEQLVTPIAREAGLYVTTRIPQFHI